MVSAVSPIRARRFVNKYHYSGTTPTIMYSFGLFQENELIGVCTFGKGANRNMMKPIEAQGWNFLELTRLALKYNRKNEASRLVAKSLELLPKSTLVVSYADRYWNHSGKIYQATNWLYTGIGAIGYTLYLDGEKTHIKSLWEGSGSNKFEVMKRKYGDRLQAEESPGKHRYFFPLGRNKKEKKQMKKWIDEQFGIKDFPKEESERYDADEIRDQKKSNKKLKTII